ncbi:hypothetical protein APHAL10511_003211 [Amanita phalloides]|nr:hypothetical protein APHAL10511_003211 [Amanita phalloides]
MPSDDGPQSSEDGSGLHSPVFRYQYGQYPYALSAMATHQQLPHLNPRQVPDSPAHAPYPRSHPALRHPPPAPHSYRQMDYRYLHPSTDPIHDPSFSRPSAVPAISNFQISSPSQQPSAPKSDPSPPIPSSPTAGPTKQRKEISNVVIACNQCRSRKIRCDSKRPTCNNCARRSNACVYDAVPKRRGPDKRPGTRQRRPKKRILEEPTPAATSAKRRRTSGDQRAESQSQSQATMTTSIKTDQDHVVHSRTHLLSGTSSVSLSSQMAEESLNVKSESPPLARGVPYEPRQTTNPYPRLHVANPYPPNTVCMAEDKRSRWNAILASYSPSFIADAFSYLVADAPQWFCFVNVDHLMDCLSDEERRIHIQPAFVYAGMALATLMKSSEKGRGATGRNAAMHFASSAQAAYKTSYRAGWIDVKLAGAAFIMSLFESSVHPSYDPDRLSRALHELDGVIAVRKLTLRDANDPLVTKFRAGTVPTIPETASYGRAVSKRCACVASGASPDPQTVQSLALPWDPTWTAEEIEAEENRRLCWNALAIISIYNTLSVCHGNEPDAFWLADPGNYAILFPGEAVDRLSPSFSSSPDSHSQPVSPKESVWAVYCRSMLLFNFCTRLVWGGLGTEDKSELAAEAVNESMSLQDSLDAHVCNFDSIVIHRCRELIQNSRFLIKRVHRSIIGFDDGPSKPFSSRGEAEQWLSWTKRLMDQADRGLGLRQHLDDKAGSMWTRRPFDVTWYSNQLALCLRMWSHDRTLLSFLDLGKTVLRVVDVLNGLWPSSHHQRYCEELRSKLVDACAIHCISVDVSYP